ncbi:MAG TPA: Dabb family protein [Tepidisphaeraceae bacterium]|jgi:hypothetical protein|nr:Dabb family protein [Tepidisphaeraceae bacterium]
MIRSTGRMVLFLAVLTLGCASNHKGAAEKGPVAHVIVCWLKQPGDPAGRAELIRASKAFEAQIPGLIRVYAGEVLPSTRPVVDSSYDVAVVMLFRDQTAMQAYEKNPIHEKAVRETLKPLTSKLQIYDFIDQANEKGRSKERPFTGVVTMH